ncbi:hypothetical protein CANMA_000826 [Candida margitis]|uniref:uncharacterized protein n=1 Tax=Candida margitis TaxID=1775924 RepID=UPI002225E762|nr:uncharacterized protein CANMA_000826 [Candida margitis]KAI5970214.1 hypothetical protein CANMA_000826 [Candida margitis]
MTHLPYAAFNPPSSLIKIVISQCVTLIFIPRFSPSTRRPSRCNQGKPPSTAGILFEVLLCITANAASLYTIGFTGGSESISTGLRVAVTIQVIIIYALFIFEIFF